MDNFQINDGLHITPQILLDINDGLISAAGLDDRPTIISSWPDGWGTIILLIAEVRRELASGLSCWLEKSKMAPTVYDQSGIVPLCRQFFTLAPVHGSKSGGMAINSPAVGDCLRGKL